VVGALVVPFFLAAVLAGEIIGKAALLFQLGRLVGRSTGRSFVPLAGVLVGALLMTLLYLVPFFGLLVNTVTNFWALGAASLALTARFRRESPKPAPDSGRPPGFPTPGPGPVPSHPPAPSGTPGIIAAPALLAVTTVPPSVTHSTEPASPVDVAAPFQVPASDSVSITAGPLPDPSAPATPEPARPIPHFVPPSSAAPAPAAPPTPPEALTLPRAGFGRRFLASVIDWIVLPFSSFILLEALLHFHGSPFPLVWIFFAAYFAGFYVWKNTTLGGLILGLKVVRLDGRRIDYPCAIVRTLGTVLSVLIGGIGWFSCIWDKERQAWHDKLAGTVVVRVEKMPPLV
jgi:hypothetical protein